MKPLQTVSGLAKRFGVSLRQVEHAIASRHVKPTSRLANARVFDDSAARCVRDALIATGAIASKRTAAAGKAGAR